MVVAHNALLEFPVHIKIDTGMNRFGIQIRDEIEQLIIILKKFPQLKVKSVFSHLVASDDSQMDDFTLNQIAKFEQLTQCLQDNLTYPIDRHILNSAGIERFPSHQFEMVRLGIGLYGVSSTQLPLKPIGILKSTISQVKVVEPGETVGYNRSGKIERPSEIGIVPLGYADGLDRRLGNGVGHAFINNRKVPITGNICMDMCMIDVTGLDVKPGDEVEFFGEHISIQEIARAIGTIPYEILTGISQRVKRVYIQE
jgi:Alr-MurF fusion protein